MLARQTQDGLHRVLALGLALGCGQAGITEAIAAVHEGRVHGWPHQGAIGADEYRHVQPAALDQGQGVAGGVGKADVAGGDGDAYHLGARVAQGHQQGEGVVHAGVGVDQEFLLGGHGILVVCGSQWLASAMGRAADGSGLAKAAELTGASVMAMVGQGPPYAPA